MFKDEFFVSGYAVGEFHYGLTNLGRLFQARLSKNGKYSWHLISI